MAVALLAGLPPTAAAESAAGITWTAPSAWKSQGERPMRAATYVVPPAAGDKDAGECVVYYFGEGQGGSVDANLKRWEGQFSQKNGAPVFTKGKAAGLPLTTMDLSGTYLWSASPMSPDKVAKPGYRMLASIVETPQGPVFFKFTAPAKTLAANEKAFQTMLQGIKK